ncbi:MAG: 50S ribosomal protein L29 [bacterium]
MKILELKGKSKKEMENFLAEKRAQLTELKFKVATDSLKDMRELRVIKKDIARLLTALNSLKI